MELIQNKIMQRKPDLYSSQTKLVQAEVQSISDTSSVSIERETSEKSDKKKKQRKKSQQHKADVNLMLEHYNHSYQVTENENNSERECESSLSSNIENRMGKPSRDALEIVEDLQKPIMDDNESSSYSHSLNKRTKTKLKTKNKMADSQQSTPNTKSPSKKSISADIEMTPIKVVEQKIDTTNLKIIGLYIHRASRLRNHPFLTACEIVISLYNFETGKCLNKDKSNNFDIRTCLWEYSHSSYPSPHWNELLIFDNPLTDIIDSNDNLIIFLEVNKSTKVSPNTNNGTENCVIAWSFIKLPKEKKRTYVNKKIKLQMYEPIENTDVYGCWLKKSWKAYPSDVDITVKGYKTNRDNEYENTMQYSVYSLMKTNRSSMKSKSNDIGSPDDTADITKRDDKEKCKIFNSVLKSVESRDKCCFVMKFSSCGKYLASSLKIEEAHIVVIMTCPDFVEVAKLKKHKDMIYDLSWNSSSTHLISASSDATVCVWENSGSKFSLMQQLKHDTFVYCATFCTISPNIIATGSYDKLVRVWLMDEDKKVNLHQKLNGHDGFVNSVCFSKKSKAFYSGDSVGLIIKWGHENNKWEKLLFIKCSEIRDNIINDLEMFPCNQRLLIVMRNSVSWVMDIATSSLMLCYRDGINYKYQLRGCITPCGSFVIIGNCIWNAATGQLFAIYNPAVFNYQTVTAVDYHPFYNIASIACGFGPYPILICSNRVNKKGVDILNMELLVYENENFQETLAGIKNEPKKDNKRPFTIKQTIANGERSHEISTGNRNEKIQSCKLLNLIDKMDRVILTVKHEQKAPTLKKIGSEVIRHIVNEKQTSAEAPQQLAPNEEQEEFKIDIESQMSDGTYTVDNSTLSEAESIHTYTVSPNPQNKQIHPL